MKSPTHSTKEQNNHCNEALKNPRIFQQKYSMRYYLATRILPKRVRSTVELLYAFVRIPDEIIDTEYKDNLAEGLIALSQFEDTWQNIWKNNSSDNLFLTACKSMFIKHKIPFEHSLDFFSAMKQDATVSRYATYHDLEKYMHGSAGVVGYMLSSIFGYKDSALPYAQSLAYAMQMTNFLRDIKEDYVQRNRIYIPQEDMERFGVTEAHIQSADFNTQFKNMMNYEVERTKVLYQQGYKGIHLLSNDTRLAVFVAGRMYERVLDRIEKNAYNPFIWKSDTIVHKIWYLVVAVVEYNFIHKVKYTHVK
jgi:phytoene synthase